MKLDYKSIVADDGAEICYADVGTGRPLVYVYGFGESVALVNALLERLSSRFRCICFDQRGFGSSPSAPNIGVERSALDLRCLIAKLNLQDVSLVGYSMGGSVAFSYIERFGTERLRNLVLADTAPKLLNDDSWNLGLWQGSYVYSDYERDVRDVEDDPELFHLRFYARASMKIYDKKQLDDLPDEDDKPGWLAKVVELTRLRESLVKRVFGIDYPAEKRRVERRYWETMTLGDWRDALPLIDVPTLCLCACPGSLYSPSTSAYMASRIPNAKTLAIPDAAHTCPKDNLGTYSDMIADFCFGESSAAN